MKASTIIVGGALLALGYYVLRRTQSSTGTAPVGSLGGTGSVANNNGGPLPMSGSDEMWNSGAGGGGGISITFGW